MAEPRYTDPENVRNLLSRDVGYKGSTAATLSDPQILQAIEDAEGEVDGVLRRRYPLPLSTPVPDLISTIAAAIAAYNADLVFRGSTPYQTQQEPVLLRLRWARDLLEQIANGEIDAGIVIDPDAVVPPTSTGEEATIINPYEPKLIGWQDVEPCPFPWGTQYRRDAIR